MDSASTTSMAKDEDEKGLDEHTRIGGGPPKLPGAPAATPPTPASTPAAPDEHTRLGVAPPPAIGPRPPMPPAASPADGGESTRLATAPPPIPKAPAAPPPPTSAPPRPSAAPAAPTPAAAPPPAAPAGDFTEHTVLLSDIQKQAVPTARLQRMQPPGRSDVVTLDRTHYLVGRLPSCDLRLYSQTASREHAQLTAREGRWYLTPVAGKSVLVNGTPVKEEVPLTHKMRLQFGGDELLFLDESGVTAAESAPRGAAGLAGGNRWLIWVAAALFLLLVLWLWAGR
jgi:pSer/pThr/pTyr-binding forkhead associated (FHA) protein